MPNAVAHILTPIILLNLYRDYIAKKRFNLKYVMIAGIGGILPDIDVVTYWLLNALSGTALSEVHRTITHTPLAIALLLIAALAAHKLSRGVSLGILALTFGYATHLILDYSLTGTIMLLYPFTTARYGLGLIPATELGSTLIVGIDAILLTTWLVYDFSRKNIKDFV